MSKKRKAEICFTDWMDIYNNLHELAVSSFEWEGLPDTINPRRLELDLFEHGQVAIFNDDLLGVLSVKCNPQGTLDVYGDPIKILCVAPNGYSRTLNNKTDAVVIYNNHLRYNMINRLMAYAKRIANIENTIDINVNGQKTPYMLRTSKKQEFSIKNLYSQIDDFEPVVIVDENIDIGGLIVTPTLAPYVADKLEEQKRKIWNEALSYLGIDNNSSEKSERLVVAEVMVSNGLAAANRLSRLKAREQAAAEINRMFGLNVSVKISNVSMISAGETQPEDLGGDEVE